MHSVFKQSFYTHNYGLGTFKCYICVGNINMEG